MKGMALPGLTPIPFDYPEEEFDIVGFDLKPIKVASSHKFGKCRKITEFEKLGRIEEGHFGTFYKAQDKKSKKVVTIKKMRVDHENESLTKCFHREINILHMLKHENIVNLMCVAAGSNIESNYLVLEHCTYVLATCIADDNVVLEIPQVKLIMRQMFVGLDYIHKQGVIHRNLTPSIILFTDAAVLKISGFEQCRRISPEDFSPDAVPRWYRAPEILFGSTKYSSAVDMWSAGCIFAELMQRKPFFNGDTDYNLIAMFIDVLGTPSETTWPGFSELPLIQNYNLYTQPMNCIKTCFPDAPKSIIRLLCKLFLYDPKRRFTAEECLNHEYFEDTDTYRACSIYILALCLQQQSKKN